MKHRRRPTAIRHLSLATLTALMLTGCAAPPGRLEQRRINAERDLALLAGRAPQPAAPLSLDDALRYALQYNVELWIGAQERAFQRELQTQSLLKMLPQLILGGETSRRSEYDAATSVSLESGNISLEASYSAEKQVDRWDLAASWSLLDFGISYFRARQQAQRVAIAAEHERRVRQTLALEVTRAWWQAVAARRAARDVTRYRNEVEVLLGRIRAETAAQSLAEADGLRREAVLLEALDELVHYERVFESARAELARLLGLPPGCAFELADVDFGPPAETQAFDIAALEHEALVSRPELFEKDMEQAISRDEAHVALARMFPNVTPFWTYGEDQNQYLAFNHWYTAGLRASWDLLAIPERLVQRRALNLQTSLIEQKRAALAVAILAQLHIALVDYRRAFDELELRASIASARGRLADAVDRAAVEGQSHAGEALENRLRALKASAEHALARANVEIAHARVLASVGRDPRVPERPAEPSAAGRATDRPFGYCSENPEVEAAPCKSTDADT